MSHKIHRIPIDSTILRIDNTQQVYPHRNREWVYIDHPTSTIQPSSDRPFIGADNGRPIIDFDTMIHTVFAPSRTKHAHSCMWITKAKTLVEIQHIITMSKNWDGYWEWTAQLHVRRGHTLEPVGKPFYSERYLAPSIIETCYSLLWLFPVQIDSDLSPDLASEN